MNDRDIQFWNSAILCPFGIVMNVLLLFMITFYSGQTLDAYKQALYLGVSVDLCFSVWNWLFNNTTTIIDGFYFMTCNGILGQFSHTPSLVFFALWLVLIYWSLTVLPVQVIYRTVLIFRNQQMNICLFFGLILLSIIPIIEYVRSVVAATVTATEVENMGCRQTFAAAGWVHYGLDTFACFPLQRLSGNELKPFLIVVVSYSIIISCSAAIYWRLRYVENHLGLAPASSYHRQISIVLAVESLLPLVSLVLPIIFDLLGVFIPGAYLDIGFVRSCAFVAAIWGPCINPVVKLTVIANYRNGVRKLCKRLLTKKKNLISIFVASNS